MGNDEIERAMRMVQEGPAEESSGKAFLSDLAQAAPDAKGLCAVEWNEAGDVVEVAGDVLTAYREEGEAAVVTSGYLDLQGNVWAALLRDARGWVDVVAVTEREVSGSCGVRVVRMLPMREEARDGGG